MKKYLLIHRDRHAFSGGYSVVEFDSAAEVGDYLLNNKVNDPIFAQRLSPKFELAAWEGPAAAAEVAAIPEALAA